MSFIGLALAIISVPAEVASSVILRMLWIAAAGVTVIAWFLSARQVEKAERHEREAKDLREVLNAMAPSVSPLKGTAVENLSLLKSHELQTRVHDLARRMRDYEHRKREAEDNARSFRLRPAAQTEEEKTTQWNEEQRKMDRIRHDAAGQFKTQFLPEAIALRDELERRLMIVPDEANARSRRPVALEYGMLSGVDPMTEAAGYLEALARKL